MRRVTTLVSRRRGPSARAAVALILLTAAPLSSCGGGSKGLTTKDFIDNEKVERAIEKSVLEQRKRKVVASCPALQRVKKGGVFVCTVVSGTSTTRFKVTVQDDHGTVHYEAVR